MSLLLLLPLQAPVVPDDPDTTYPGSETFPGAYTFPGVSSTAPTDPGGGTGGDPGVPPTPVIPGGTAGKATSRCMPMRLEAVGLEPLTLDSDEIGAASLNLGDAETREVVSYAAGADGTVDATTLIGARPVTLQVLIESNGSGSSRLKLTNRLRAFTSPRLRPTLYFQLSPDDPEMMVSLRRGPFSDVWTPNTVDRTKVTVQWIAPLGVLESAELHVNTFIASGSGGGSGGRATPWTSPRTYASGGSVGSGTGGLVTNAGTAESFPLLRIYGPCVDPVVIQTTQDKRLSFTGLEILAGEFVEVDTRAKTIRYLGNPGDSRYDRLDFEESAWWTLSPGENRIRFAPLSSAAPSNVEISYRDAWY